jgi:lysophospholipase L1-like esterase
MNPTLVALLVLLLTGVARAATTNPVAISSVAAPNTSIMLPALAADDRWAKEMLAFAAEDTAHPPPERPIVFTGSSSIRLWKDLGTDYPGLRVMNRGFGGSRVKDLVRHFDRVILQYRPRQVVIYSGTNDINGGVPVDEVVADVRQVVDRINRELPEARVLFLSLALNPARWAKRDLMLEANAKVRAYLEQDQRNQFLDVNTVMLGADGLPKPDIFVADKLHMNRKGYELWAPLVRPWLAP